MPTKALQKTSTKEVDLATAINALSEQERRAYKHFVNSGMRPIAEESVDQLFRLYHRGQTTVEIQKLFPQYSLSQVVAARVMYGWDERKETQVANIKTEVPAKVETTSLETQEFLSNLLHATQRKWNDALLKYVATGDEKLLTDAGVPVPTTLKELSALLDMYMKISGTDSKRVDVRVAAAVVHKHTKVQPEEAEAVMDALLNDEPVQDAEFTDSKDEEPKAIAPIPPSGKSPEEMIDFLVKGGMPLARAEQVVRQLKAKADNIADDIKAIANEVADGSKEPLN